MFAAALNSRPGFSTAGCETDDSAKKLPLQPDTSFSNPHKPRNQHDRFPPRTLIANKPRALTMQDPPTPFPNKKGYLREG